jgi:IS1 transposase
MVIGTTKVPRNGDHDSSRICTSHIERQNLTIRMQNRRMARLTNAFSKKWRNHQASLAVHFAHYNFCRVHSTIKQTPEMAAGLEGRPWTVRELIVRSTLE